MIPEILSIAGAFFCHFRPFSAPFYPTNHPKNHHFEKLKKTAGEIVCYHHVTCAFQSESSLYSLPECQGTPCTKQVPCSCSNPCLNHVAVT